MKQIFPRLILLVIWFASLGKLSGQALNLPHYAGQSLTLLSDGSLLAAGGTKDGKAIGDAFLLKLDGSAETLQSTLLTARSGHSATALPDGTVLIFGGVDSSNQLVQHMEIFNPATKLFTASDSFPLTPRTQHTATLLTNGLVVVIGGSTFGGAPPQNIQFWDFRSGRVQTFDVTLLEPRQGHLARLNAQGEVVISGGRNFAGDLVRDTEIFDPSVKSFQIADAASSRESDQSSPFQVSASLPTDYEDNFSVAGFIALRFTELLDERSMQHAMITLSDKNGHRIQTGIAAAEQGRLLFIIPLTPLVADADFKLKIQGLTSLKSASLPDTSIRFHTAGHVEQELSDAWIPDREALRGNWNSKMGSSEMAKLPALKAQPGVTALAGQVLGVSGGPIARVTLQIENHRVETDTTGRFLLTDISPGHHVLEIDGATANRKAASYGYFEAGVDIRSGVTTVLNYTIWMSRLDTEHAVKIAAPTSQQDTVISTPLLPGLELHLPAGTTIMDRAGKRVTEVTITPIPLDKPPFPLPTGLQVPLYFTIQPGGSDIRVQALGATTQGARLFYPNTYKEPSGTIYNFWNYDPAGKGWYIYGNGKVTETGQQIVPDAGVYVYTLTGAMVGGASAKNAIGANGGGGTDGDPVDLSSGQFVYTQTDISVTDLIPISLVRTYTANDHTKRAFGIGSTTNYDMFMVGDTYPYTYQELILPDGTPIRCNRTSVGTSWSDAVYGCTSSRNQWYGATLRWNYEGSIAGAAWILQTRDGTMYGFPEAEGVNAQQRQALVGVRDVHGNKISLLRDASGYLTRITSPNGRYISLLYDAQHRITQAGDNMGREVQYTYDTGGRVATVVDVDGGTTSFAYNVNDQMTSITDARQHTYLTNEYDSFGRVTKQTQADGGTYTFDWTPSSNSSQQWVTSGAAIDPNSTTDYEGYTGLISQVSVTDPGGYVHQVSFNNLGMATTDIRALGEPEQQTTSIQYFANNLIRLVTDPHGRNTAFTYDSYGNKTSTTMLSGTSEAVTYSMTYDANFSRPLSSTDPLGHVSSYTYNTNGDLIHTQDALGHGVTLEYDSTGRLTSSTDAVGNTKSFFYSGGDLTAIQDAIGNQTILFPDAIGRTAVVIDPLGNSTQYTYNNAGQVTGIKNAQGHSLSLGRDANGNLQSLQDYLGNTTQYVYDAMDRLIAVTDPLSHTSSSTYDLRGNPVSSTDRLGQITVETFDGLGRNVFRGYGATSSGGSTTYQSSTSFQYDSGNRLSSASDSISGSLTQTYDDFDRLTNEATPSGAIAYTYDAAGRRLTSQMSGTTSIGYGYDDANRVTSITQGTSQVAFSYDNTNRRSTLTLPNGVIVQYGYDQDSRLQTLQYLNGTTAIGDLSYVYDAAGRKTETNGSLAQTNLPLALNLASYDSANRLVSWDGIATTHDLNGNMTSLGGTQFSWDARGHLNGINGGATASFIYDALGRRSFSGINGQNTSYRYDGVNRVGESVGGSLTTSLSGGLDEYFQHSGPSGVSYPLADSLGSAIGMTDGTGALSTRYWYSPYGETTTSGTVSNNVAQYAGRDNDGTGLYYYRARYYSPAIGRFISEDPIGFAGGINRYAYVGGDPIRFNDPFGTDKNSSDNGACHADSGPGSIISVTGTKDLTELGAAVGAPFGPIGAIIGGVVGSQFGLGVSVSYVPSTQSFYAGGVATFAPLQVGGGSGFSASYSRTAPGQNPNAVANGTSYSVSSQPLPVLGEVVTESPGSGPAVTGYQVGTRAPLSYSASHSFCVWGCGC